MYAAGYTGNLTKNNYGILEETDNNFIDNKILDTAVTPLLAFDKNLNRIGYGKGYYDKFLNGLDIIKIGLAFAVCEAPLIEAGGHDVKLDYIITEEFLFPLLREKELA